MAEPPHDDRSLTITPTLLRNQVQEKLRIAIAEGRFAPGDHLSDRVLCDLFGVSRTVVREAVRQLEAEGLIETLPHRGSFVKAMSADEAAQFYDVRGVLEALAARSFTQNATNEELAELQAVFARLRKAASTAGKVDILAIKQDFYEVLLCGARNDYLTSMLNQILNRNTTLRATSLSAAGRLQQTVAEIGRLMDALAKRDADEAWAASLDHVNRAAAVALAILRRQSSTGKDT